MVSLSEVVLVSLMVVYTTFSFAALCLVAHIPSISSWVQIIFHIGLALHQCNLRVS